MRLVPYFIETVQVTESWVYRESVHIDV